MRARPVQERLWEKVDKGRPDECWPWTACRNAGGYGVLGVSGKNKMAHRLAYEALVGPIPDGLQIDHLCRNRACINPAHMEIVANRENVLRGIGPTAINARKTHCSKGHRFDEKNTRYTSNGAWRLCRTCDRAWRLARQKLGENER